LQDEGEGRQHQEADTKVDLHATILPCHTGDPP
jgi:hypothetical protein